MRNVNLYLFLLISLLASALIVWSQGNEAEQTGRKIFVESRCYTCHTINAQSQQIEKEKEEFAKAKGVEVKEDEEDDEEEGKKGGDLSNVGAQRDSKWIKDFSKDPKAYFKDDTECQRLAKKKYRKRFKGSEADLDILVAYLSSLKYEEQQEAGFKSCLKD